MYKAFLSYAQLKEYLTVLIENGRAYVQAGAGIVADSNPAAEYEETRDKARALVRSLELAQQGL